MSEAAALRSLFPPVYHALLDPFFDRPKVEEKRATCDDCAMCDKGQPSPVPMDYFRPDTKCCTYFPQLPNYLVGAILADPSPDMEEGRKRLRTIIASRVGTTPHWVNRPRKQSLILTAYGEGFGRAKSLLCPFFDESNLAASCTIWRHRETVCMTYYCKYTGGQRGFDFWVSLKWYAGYLQRRLTQAAVAAIDPRVVEPVVPTNQLTLEDIEDLPPKASDYVRWWGSWVGREEEFYVRCHDWVRSAGREAFAANVDQSKEGQQYLTDMIAKYERLQGRVVPDRLVRNARMKEAHVGEKVVVTTYHRFDSFALDKDLYEVIGLFRGSETLEENLARLKKDGIELVPELIEYLFAAGVLVEPRPPETTTAQTVAGGDLEGRRATLRVLLEARGIATNAAAQVRITNADRVALELWTRKAATASSLDEVIEDAK
jgi:hypothetical protein